jgi:hydrogenase/urease accessory protein HupE
MAEGSLVNEDAVRALARAAALPLAEDRIAAVTALLGDWLAAANDLSRTMSAPEHRGTAPITVFAHPPTDPKE